MIILVNPNAIKNYKAVQIHYVYSIILFIDLFYYHVW